MVFANRHNDTPLAFPVELDDVRMGHVPSESDRPMGQIIDEADRK
jgi:hypothetical protein